MSGIDERATLGMRGITGIMRGLIERRRGHDGAASTTDNSNNNLPTVGRRETSGTSFRAEPREVIVFFAKNRSHHPVAEYLRKSMSILAQTVVREPLSNLLVRSVHSL
ncbi:hypothetical protein [Halorubrum coriense]|uniref:hypothetical protein n=1 Tax=Halorubrum coriense TaxID=64713 RepID=UPI0012688A60|nr:hypothetical protein [Halorubrum coriense]